MTATAIPRRARGVAGALAALAACSSNATPAAPTAGAYVVDFPTIGAAIASQSVTLAVYDSSVGCVALLEAARSATLPNLATPLQSITTSACGLDAVDGGTSSFAALPYGTYAVLVVAAEGPDEPPFLDGCTVATFSDASPGVAVVLDVVSDAVTVPPTPPSCSGLKEFCATIGAGGAACQRQADDAG